MLNSTLLYLRRAVLCAAILLAPVLKAAGTPLPPGNWTNLLHLGSSASDRITGYPTSGQSVVWDNMRFAGFGPERIQQPFPGELFDPLLSCTQLPMVWTALSDPDGVWGGVGDPSVSYYAIYIWSPSDRQAKLAYDENYGLRVSMDGLDTPLANFTAPAAGSTPAFTLSSGWHWFVIKTQANGSGDHFSLRLTDVADNDFNDLGYQLSDPIAPTVTAITPSDGAINVALWSDIQFILSEPMNTSINPDTVVSIAGGSVAGTWAWTDPNILTFTPSSLWQPGATYAITLNGTATDLSGNPLAAATYHFSAINSLSTPSANALNNPIATRGVLQNILLNGSGFTQGGVIHPAGAVPFAGHYYQYHNQMTSWQDAKALGAAQTGHLVTPTSNAEDDFVWRFGGYTNNWIGLTDELVEGTFVWITGETDAYRHFAPGEPSDWGDEDYCIYWWGFQWNDVPSDASAQRPYVTEFEQLAVPTLVFKKSGQPDIVATNVRFNNSGTLSFDLDTSSAAVGPWDLLLTNPDGVTTTLLNALTIDIIGPRVTALTPAPGSAVNASPSNIVATFSANIDPVSVSAQTFTLVGSGLDGVFDTADDVIITPAAVSVNGNTATLDLTGVKMPNDTYQVRLYGNRGAGTALSFSPNMMAKIPNFGLAAPTSEVTIEFWQYATSSQDSVTFGMNPDDYNNRFNGHFSFNGTIIWDFGNYVSGPARLQYPAPSILNQWNHFALVASTAGNYMRIYRNGVLEASKPGVDGFDSVASDLWIGRDGTQYSFAGQIDEFRIWNVARTQREILSAYRRKLQGNEPGLVACWDFDEGSGQVVNDRSPNGHHGTLGNDAAVGADDPNWVVSGAPIIAGITDGSGNVLDGEPNAQFPSGDGTAGGDFVATFTVSTPPLQMTSLNITPGSVLNTPPASITATFSANLDPASVTAGSFALVGRGPDGVFDTADDVVIVPTSFNVTGNNLTLDLSGSAVPNDTYRLNFFANDTGRALSFDAAQMVRIPNFGMAVPVGEITVEFWQRATSALESVTFGMNPDDYHNRFNGHFSFYGTIIWDYGDYVSGPARLQYPAPNILNQWNHFALVASLSGNFMKIYRNGVLEASKSGVEGFDHVLSDLWIGRDGTGYSFAGEIDEFRIWNFARSQAEIVSTFKHKLTGNEPGLTAYWNFDEGSGQIVHDSAGAHDGTLGNDANSGADDPTWVVSGAPISRGINDVYGNAFDGEANATMPSGNGTPGGDFTATFTVNSTLRLSTLTPTPNATLGAPPASIVATFSNALDPSSVNAATVKLVRAGVDGVLGTSDDVPLSPTSVVVNNNTVTLDISGMNVPNDVYKLTLKSGTQPVSSTALRGYWLCDEGQGSMLADASNNGNNGSFNGTVAWGPGVGGSGLQFFDNNGYVIVPAAAGALAAGDFSVSAWIKTTDADFDIIGNRHSVAHGAFWTVMISPTGKLKLEIDQDSVGTNYFVMAGATSVNNGNWRHLAVVRTGNAVKLYVDGVLDGSGTAPGATNVSSGGTVLIGDNPYINKNVKFGGLLDEIRVFGRQLSGTEIQTLASFVPSGICNQNNQALDGEPNASLPSGDGTSGGDFTSTFTVALIPLQITALSPAPDTALTSPLTSIVATFNQNVDPASVTSASFSLIGRGTDHVFGTSDDRVIIPNSVSVSGNTATLDVSGASMPNDTYQITLRGGPGSAPANGLVGRWMFDEGSGTLAADSSATPHNGTLVNGPAWTAGTRGSALQFNGSNTYVNVPNSVDLGGGSFTLAAWIWRDGGIERKFLDKWNDDSGAFQFSFQVYQDSKLWLSIRQTNGVEAIPRGTTVIATGQWYHVAAVADAPSHTVSFYVNGAAEPLQSNPNWDGTVRSVAMEMNIGRKTSNWDYWQGKIDGVHVYNRALSQSEVQNVMNVQVTDLSGNPLDGEPHANLPSGDGTPGGDFTATFKIDAAPVAANQSVATPAGVAKPITLSASDADNDPLSWTIVDQPAHGSLSGTAPNVIYTPDGTFTTGDSFTFKVNDGAVDSNIATVTISIPTTVTALSFTPGATFTAPPASITATFSQNIDSASVNASSVKLVRAGPDGVFDTADDVLINPAGVSVNANTATLDLTGVKVPNDTYRVLLPGGQASAPSAGLLAYYTCNENQGTTLGDFSGHGYDGVLVGNSTWGTGFSGSALKFDDTNGYVEISHPPAGDLGTGDFTVAFRIKTTDANFQVIGNRHSTTHAPFWTVRATAAGKMELEIDQDTNGTNYNADFGTAPINDNSWHHIVVTRTGATLTIYVDGALDATSTGPGTANVTNGGEVLIGDNPFVGLNPGDKFAGLLDDVRIYNRLLTAPEIQTLSTVSGPAIRDVNGNALDGEPNAQLPSGDGNPGGDFTTTFTVNAAPLQVTALSVTTGSVFAAPPTSITATFSQNIDPASVTAGSFSLVGRGPDGVFDTADDVVIVPAGVSVNANVATLNLTGASISPDVYRMTLHSDSGPSNSGLAAFWRFDEVSGTAVTDSSSSGITGQISDGVVRGAGIDGGGLDFNGSDGVVSFGDVLNNLNPPATFSAWVYRRGTGAVTILSTDDANNYYGFWMHIWDDNTLEISYGDGGGTQFPNRRTKRSTNAIVSQTWTHVCAVVRGPADMSLYIDGVDAGGVYSGSGNAIVHSADPFVLGHKTLGNTYIDAKLDEVRIYNRALSIQEVQNLRRATPITDLYGNPLDGEPNANFPSGNGTPGGDFTATFRVDAPPAALNQSFSIHSGTSWPVVLSGYDPENDPLTYAIAAQPSHGTLSGTPPFVTYAPFAGFVGSDSFTYKANDGYRNSSSATVSFDVTNAVPSAVAQSLSAHFGVAAPITLGGTDADSDALLYTVLSQPGHGALTGSPPNLAYTAEIGYVGSDSFTFAISDGIASSAPATISITDTNTAPNVILSAAPTSVVPGAPVTFNAAGSDADNDALSYAWDFGDGESSTEQNPAHAYAQVGSYTATVTVSDASGASATASVLIQVSKAPVVRLTTDEVVGFGGLPLLFDASYSTDPENQIASYDWDFGDGTPHGSGQIISKVYDQPGTYTVTLTITDAAGVASTLTRVIEVLSGDEVGLFSGYMKYKVSWNRRTENKDSLTFEAGVNVGDDLIHKGTPVALEIVGQRFAGVLDLRLRDYSNTNQKWQVKAQIRHQPFGTVSLKVTIKKANLGLSFNQAGVVAGGDPHDIVSQDISAHLEIGTHSFEMLLPTDFKFSGDRSRAKGDGASE